MFIGIFSLSKIAALLLAVSVDAGLIGEYDAGLIARSSETASWGKIKNLVVFGDR